MLTGVELLSLETAYGKGGSLYLCVKFYIVFSLLSSAMIYDLFKYKSFTKLKKRVLRFPFYVSWINYDITLVSNLIVCKCTQFLCVNTKGERSHMLSQLGRGQPFNT